MSSHEVVHGDVARKLHSHSRAKIETYCSIVFAEGKRDQENRPANTDGDRHLRECDGIVHAGSAKASLPKS